MWSIPYEVLSPESSICFFPGHHSREHLELRGSFLTVSLTQYTAIIQLHFCDKIVLGFVCATTLSAK